MLYNSPIVSMVYMNASILLFKTDLHPPGLAWIGFPSKVKL